MFKKRFALLFFVFVLSKTIGQQTAIYTHDLLEYNSAIELYNNNQFLAAKALFEKVKNTSVETTVKGDCAYYIANCAVRLNQKDADQLIESFVQEYPTSIKRNDAYINVANYYFDNGKYSHARKWYDKIDEAALNKEQAPTYNFNNGYAFYKSKRLSEAKKYLNRVVDDSKYGSQAKYYLGFIEYEGDNYEKATQLFEGVESDDRYKEGLSYYKADLSFKSGKFQEAINLGKSQFDTSNPKEQSELSKIIGESYFNLMQYKDAIPYLKQYKGRGGKWNNTDYYQLGYAYYKQGAYSEAVGEFNKIIDGTNSIAQNAYYHLAESYLQLKQKQQALNAFKNASEMDFSKEIKEDASLNYAKLSYEIGNSYKNVPQILVDFIEAYPNNGNNQEIKSLLIDSYITSKNYKAALELLQSDKSFANKKAFQKVAFFRGVEVYMEGNYIVAMELFNKSLKEPYDPIFTARAIYWKAESDFQASNFENALIGYKQYLQLPNANQTPEYINSSYNLAYSYFKLKNYEQAIEAYKEYISLTPDNPPRKSDSYLRLGDSYFAINKFWPALENYNKAIEYNSPDADYAAFQKALSYGLIERPQKKIEQLVSFNNQFPNSIYKDDALYELGNIYVSQEKQNQAISIYNRLLEETPNSSYVPKTLLKKGLIFDNSGKSDQALVVFKEVAKNFPSTPEAIQAVSSAKLIYIDQGKVNDYALWVAGLDFVEVENAELDAASYQAAEQPYLESKPKQAITRFESYLEQFPDGLHALKAHFYIAQLYFAEDKKETAITHYKYVVDKERNEFTEQALARISELYLSNNDYKTALVYLSRLEMEADFPQNVVFAQTNSMKASYELAQYQDAVLYAEKVLQNPKVDTSIQSDAQIIIARSAMKTAQEDKARIAYQEVSKIATGKLAAEALYYDAYFKNKEQAYQASNISIQSLAKDYSGYKYFGAKGLVLMAQNFYGLKDAFQATYILESVISNFSDFPDVVEEAQTELATIKAAEAKTNSSVETQDED